MSPNTQQLHWTQRVALVRHNLHAASRSGDWCFFKTLQAAGFIEGTNHAGVVAAEIGDDADIVLAAMDNLNAGLAYVHQDAFKNVYESLKNKVRDDDEPTDNTKSKLYVDIILQRNMADMAIDKMASSAVTLIHQQPESVQDAAANVWIMGSTIVADCMEVTLKQLDDVEFKLDDFIRLEDGWNTVKASVLCAVTVLKGVFRLMDPSNNDSPKASGRSSSIASASGAVFRRLSNAFVGAPPASGNGSRSSSIVSSNSLAHGRNNSTASLGPVYRTPNYMRQSISDGCPTAMPLNSERYHHKLSTIPPTPATAMDEAPNPFDTSFPVPPVPDLNALNINIPLPSFQIAPDDMSPGMAAV